jgi:hypothetical protein
MEIGGEEDFSEILAVSYGDDIDITSSFLEEVSTKFERRSLKMTVFPVFYGEDKEDPEAYLREFRRACDANNDRDEASWVQLLPDFLEKAARPWYLRQPIVIKTNWDQLRQKFIAEFQPRESYQSLMHALSTASQQPYESVRVFCKRVREL